MEESMSEFIGIDVSKATLEVAAHASGEQFMVENTEAQFTTLCEGLHAMGPEPVVATSGCVWRRWRRRGCRWCW